MIIIQSVTVFRPLTLSHGITRTGTSRRRQRYTLLILTVIIWIGSPLLQRPYASIGLPVDEIIARSDLYEKPGKNQHAFSTDIDREGDVRTLDNIRPDSYWMNTIMHELGHGVYSYYNDRSLPFAIRDAAHTFTTEAVANFFGRYATDPAWMHFMGVIDEKEARE